MLDVPVPLLLGLNRQELFVGVGAFAGVVSALCIAAVIWLALAPVASRSWADQFGVADVASGGADPTDVIDGCPEPVPAETGGRNAGGVADADGVHESPDVETDSGAEPPAAADVAGSDTSA